MPVLPGDFIRIAAKLLEIPFGSDPLIRNPDGLDLHAPCHDGAEPGRRKAPF
jgi:hypothetical protein